MAGVTLRGSLVFDEGVSYKPRKRESTKDSLSNEGSAYETGVGL